MEPKTVEETYGQAFKEIKRRSDAKNALESGAKHFKRTENPTRMPFQIPNQDHVLVTFGTPVFAPRPLNAEAVSLRVYGCFATREDAREHASIIQSLDNRCSLLVIPRNEWILMPQTERVRDDPEEVARRTEEKLNRYHSKLEEEEEQFQQRLEDSRKPEDMGLSRPVDPPREDLDEQEEMDEAESLVYKGPQRLRTGGEVRGQTAVALCIIPDEFGECLINVLGAFETTDEANNWVQNVGSRHVADVDIYVAPACEWVFPNAKIECDNKNFREPELQRIMDAVDRDKVSVQEFEELHKAEMECVGKTLMNAADEPKEHDRKEDTQTKTPSNDLPSEEHDSEAMDTSV
jgi:hypothetical protein